MVTCLFALLTALTYLGFITHKAVACCLAVMLRTGRGYGTSILDTLTLRSYEVFTWAMNSVFSSRRNVMELLIRQNDPEFEEDIKTFLGDILSMDNTSEHLDLSKVMKMDLSGWRKKYAKTFEKLRFRVRDLSTVALKLSLSEYLRRLRCALIIKSSIVLSIVKAALLTYIHNNGGLIGYEKQRG